MRALMNRSMRRAGLAAALVSLSATTVAAQLPNASTAAFGMAGNFTAMARGYEAVAWNPANLAMPGRPFMSIGAVAVGGTLGLDPIDFRALHEYGGQVVPAAVREDWVNQARQAGGQKIRIDGGVSYLGLSVGPVGIQAGSSFYTNMNLSPDAFEALLSGNADPVTMQPKTFDFTGTGVRMGAFTTGAGSIAFGIPFKIMGGTMPDEKMTVGLSTKYVVGHGLILAEDIGSTVTPTDLQLRFAMIGVRTDENVDPLAAEFNGIAGKGLGGDLSLAWNAGPWRVGVLAENVFNSFKWDTTMLAYTPGTTELDGTTNETNWDQSPFTNAPQALKDLVTSQKFSPALTIGAAFKLTSRLTLTADLKKSTGDDNAIVVGPKSRVGVGAELRLIPFIPIRAGVASVTDGWQAGLGTGINLFGLEIGAATSIRRRGAATESGVMVGVLAIGR